MTQGIREFVNAKFGELLPQRSELTNTGFRKAVMQAAVVQFGISIASAATHYNYSLKTVRSLDPSLVEGLGRPEDKKGGRPVTKPVTVIKVKTGEVIVDGISRAKAEALILSAVSKNKPKLGIKQDIDAALAAEAEAKAAEEAAAAVAEVAPAAEAAPQEAASAA